MSRSNVPRSILCGLAVLRKSKRKSILVQKPKYCYYNTYLPYFIEDINRAAVRQSVSAAVSKLIVFTYQEVYWTIWRCRVRLNVSLILVFAAENRFIRHKPAVFIEELPSCCIVNPFLLRYQSEPL